MRPVLLTSLTVNQAAVSGGRRIPSATANESAVARKLSRPLESAQVRRRFSDLRNAQRELTLPAPFGTLLPSRTAGAATHVD
jgi:hypothetical protein